MIGFISFLEILAQWEMQNASSRMWTREAKFTAFDYNHNIPSVLWLLFI